MLLFSCDKFAYIFIYLIFNILYPNTESHSWSSIKIKKKIGTSLELNFKEELRLKNNFSDFGQLSTDIDIAYVISDNIKVSFPYKYIIYGGHSEQSLSFSSKLNYTLRPINYVYRYEFESVQSPVGLSKNRIRNKIYINFNIHKNSRMLVNHERLLPYKSNLKLINETRSSIGLLIKITKSSLIKIAYTRRIKNFSNQNYFKYNIINTELIYNFL